jgi:hypothetical protein
MPPFVEMMIGESYHTWFAQINIYSRKLRVPFKFQAGPLISAAFFLTMAAP